MVNQPDCHSYDEDEEDDDHGDDNDLIKWYMCVCFIPSSLSPLPDCFIAPI